MNKEKEHWCGCKTKKIDGVINFNKICKKHKNNGKYVWIVLQHDDAEVSLDENGVQDE